ncbi:MAG TPA: hypothetical protein VMW24_09110 [Sedimentisphaerales bacterium]|nr:hypothetical protein [Sedimentisphaerales bacterium]
MAMPKGSKRFEEKVPLAIELVESEGEEPKGGGPWRIKGIGITANVVNANNRRYPAEVLSAAIKEMGGHLHESAGQGRLSSLAVGESDHPEDKGNRRPLLSEVVVNWDEVEFDGQQVVLEGNLLGTSRGKDIRAQIQGGVIPGISQRGYGEAKIVKEGEAKIEEVTMLVITGYDLTAPNEQSDPNAGATYFESQQEDEMNLEELLKLLKDHPEVFEGITEAQVKKMGEVQLKALEENVRKALGIDENVNINESLKAIAEKAHKFEENEKKAGIEAAITEATKELPYGEKANANFVKAVRAANLQDEKAVKSLVEAKRNEYDTLFSAEELQKMGFTGKINGIAPVFEKETGQPEFAQAAYALNEAMVKSEMRKMRDFREAETRAELLTVKILERFDQLNKHHLIREAKEFNEAEQASDLSLPYSISRAIIMEAFPNLVAAGIFDVGTIETSPTRLYFEAHAAETGYSATATAEVVTMGAEETWYDLTYGRVTPGTVTVTSNPAGTTYTENTDYVIDYAAGRIKGLTAGAIDANDVLVTYTYTAIRQGEMAPIERAKVSLSYITVTAAADRLADQISREAVVFSRSQLGYDAVSRTMASLIRQTQRKIDQGLLYMALAAVKSVASNSGGTWTTGNDEEDYDDFVRLLGETKVIVANRFYTPTYILMSVTNAEDLSNWKGFKRDGFPNAILNAAGFAGGVKGLPIFASTEFPDTTVVVGNRELVMYRVFQPMIVRGPYPTYDVSGSTSKLVAADQYYTEEFNVTESPVEEKGAYLTITAGS